LQLVRPNALRVDVTVSPAPISLELTLHLRRVSRSLAALGILRAAEELSEIAREIDDLRERNPGVATGAEAQKCSGFRRIKGG
jgi:hypothetical protein